jgi:hypothetical protein
MSHSIELTGFDGNNPLAFLAALGTLRTLTLAWPDADVRLSWHLHGAWHPMLHAAHPLQQASLVEALHTELQRMKGHPALALGDNLGMPPEVFYVYAQQAQAAASLSDHRWADFAAAFACECTTTRDSKKQQVIQDTDLRTMSGAGHQDFLAVARNIVNNTTPDRLEKALFHPWQYDDPIEKQTMRWDPIDDIRYALRWRDPSGDPARKKRGTVLGANRLAIEGLPLLPTMPVGSALRTTGFTGQGSRDTFWTWPIWQALLSLDVVRSLLALRELQLHEPPRSMLARMGVIEIYRSQRVTVDKHRNFTPAASV